LLFNSYEFIFFFLPFVFLIYKSLNSSRYIELSKFFLIAASLFFYSWWNIVYLPLVLLSILFNFYMGKLLSCEKIVLNTYFTKKKIVIFSIFINICLLAYFKYADFFITNFNIISGLDINLLHLLLPLAISFFTFQQIAYLVDSYKGETKEYDFLNYALFVTFFPQLIAGPIVHHKEMMPQFTNIKNKVINYKNIAAGLFIFSIGLFKKVVIADTFAVWANNGFDNAVTLNLLEAWATSLSYTFQLYFDFSGYTDMAIGIALLFNIKLPMNFNSPYKALDIQDFWRRWHITLSRFLRDYIYIPLGGNKKGNFKTYSNLMTTFVIGGLWHGAGWTFLFWGFLHGMALVIHKLWQSLGFKIWGWLSWLITFNFVNIAWIFFRAKEWEDGIKVLSSMFSLEHIVLPTFLESKLIFLSSFGIRFTDVFICIKATNTIVLWLLFAFVLILFFKNSYEKIEKLNTDKKLMFLAIFCFVYAVLSLNNLSEFIYFNF